MSREYAVASKKTELKALRTASCSDSPEAFSPEDRANAIGQKYRGPVTLIADALCYSATDMFVAASKTTRSVRSSVDENIGAGGANVGEYYFLQELLPEAFPALPAECALRVPIRRTLRVGKNAGAPLEDLGISLAHEQRYYMTKSDVLNGNVDPLEFAGRQLKRAR